MFIIVSAELNTLSADVNTQRTNELINFLNDSDCQSFTECLGSWKYEDGTIATERSFCVEIANDPTDTYLYTLLGFCQEGVLLVQDSGEAIIVEKYIDTNGNYQVHNAYGVGIWKEITEDEALVSGCYTKLNGKYYLAS